MYDMNEKISYTCDLHVFRSSFPPILNIFNCENQLVHAYRSNLELLK